VTEQPETPAADQQPAADVVPVDAPPDEVEDTEDENPGPPEDDADGPQDDEATDPGDDAPDGE
jgi:hypothetical protein